MKKVWLTQITAYGKEWVSTNADTGRWGFKDENGDIVAANIEVGDGDQVDWDLVYAQAEAEGYILVD